MIRLLSLFVLLGLLLSACSPANTPTNTAAAQPIRVLAVETFLADMAQQVAGDRLTVESLVPIGLDPHAFEPTPADVVRIAESQLIIANGAGFEHWLEDILANAGGEHTLIEAATGLTPRQAGTAEAEDDEHAEGDPHFWLDPLMAVKYVETIRDGLIAADPAGEQEYRQNAAAYITELEELDRWIQEQVGTVPAERRLLVTNHESFGYFADRYGFQLIGTIIPSVTASASPSAQQMAALTEHIRSTGAPAIFLETGSNPDLAEQIAQETGVQVVTGLHSHSITEPEGSAPTYIDMMKENTRMIVAALR